MAFRPPGPTNVFVPSPDATGQVISFSRDPKKFALPRYVQYADVDKLVGIYTKLDPKQSVRWINSAQAKWTRGAVRPMHENNQSLFEYLEYRTQRSDYGFTLPYEVEAQASWKVKAHNAAMVLSQAMTDRTKETYDFISTAANWEGNTAACVDLSGGGKWDQASNNQASPYYLAIKKSINRAILRILKKTNGLVDRSDLRIVIGPGMAQAISETDEIRDMLKQSQFANKEVYDQHSGLNAIYNLPEKLYGLDLVVENSTIAADDVDGPDDEQRFIWDDDTVVFACQPGGIDGGPAQEGTFSTFTFYFYEQLTVESFDDARNRRIEGHVVDDRVVKMTAAASGFLLTECLAGDDASDV